MRRLIPLFIALTALLALAASAGAATTTTATPSGTPTVPAVTPPGNDAEPQPSGGRLVIWWDEPVRLHGRALALVGRPMYLRGQMSRFVRGQKVVVTGYRDGRRSFRRVVAIRGIGRGKGGFRIKITPHRTGRLGFQAVHKRTEQQVAARARPLRLRAYLPVARYGQTGTVVRLIQDRLSRVHYAVSHSGWFDGSTARAILAFRKVNRMPRTTALNGRILRMLLAGRGAFRARYPSHGRHVEGDIGRQVLALVNPGGRVFRVYHMSSGKPSTPTVLGSFRFYRKDLGTNSHGMVHSSYFIRGYAIHGYASVPVFNASHGCLRVPIPSALSIFRWVRIGQRIDVYL